MLKNTQTFKYVTLCCLCFTNIALSQKIEPTAPTQEYKTNQVQVENEKHRSVVSIPVDISMQDIAKQINSQIQGLIYEDNSYTDDNNDQFKTKVWKRAPIKVEARDSLLHYTVPLKIWAEKGYSISVFGQKLSGYKATEFAIDLSFATSFGIAPDWKVKTKTASTGFVWVTKPSINVSGIDIPITAIVSKKINDNLSFLSSAIDKNIQENFDLKPYITQAWNMIREPRLMSEEYKAWLVVSPTQILMTPFVLQQNSLKSSICLQGFTQTISGEKPPITSSAVVPSLQIVPKIPQGFQIGIVSSISYQEATQIAIKKFVGQVYEFKEGKYKIEVTSLDIYGQNDKLIIKAGLKGKLNGTIFLKGVPTYDPTTRSLSLKNLDYDLETKNILIKSANWLLQGIFVKEMEKNFVFDLGTQIDEMQKEIQTQLTNNQVSKGIFLNGKIANITPNQVYLTPQGILSVVTAKGDLQVRVNGLF